MSKVNRPSTDGTAVADQGIVEGKLVQFVQDVAPYCKGDIVRLDSEAEKYVKERVSRLGIEGSVYTTNVKEPEEHIESTAPVRVGSAYAADSEQVDEPTTVHGGTVVNEQSNASKPNKPSDSEVKDRTEDPKNPRGGTASQADHPGTQKAGQV
jgi:hypothetical protein